MSILPYKEIDRILSLSKKELTFIGSTRNWKIEVNGWRESNFEINFVKKAISIVRKVASFWFGNFVDTCKIYFVCNKTNKPVPSVHYECQIINLSPSGEVQNDICQLMFQAIHELTHYFLRYNSTFNIPDNYRWFEETICELSSQSLFEFLSKIWNNNYILFRSKKNTDVALGYLDSIESNIPKSNIDTIRAFFKLNEKELENNPYMRQANALFAKTIREEVQVNQLFWSAIKDFFELGGAGVPILDTMIKWHKQSNQEKKQFILRIAKIFEDFSSLREEIGSENIM